MSEIAGTSPGVPPMPTSRSIPEPPKHEAYSFVCMRCGHVWEQEYEIRHHVDARGREVVTYYANGRRVPSPLTRPTCQNCGGHVVRIMKSGQIPPLAAGLAQQGIAGPLLSAATPIEPSSEVPVESPAEDRTAEREHGTKDRKTGRGVNHRTLADLLHVFHRR